MRVLVGGVGYRNLRDHSVGVLVSDVLAARSWPPTVSVEDLSYNPIAVVQRLEDDPPERRFALALVVGAVERPGRRVGALTVYRWDSRLPPAEDIQAAVAEAVTGVIALDNTLIVARHFGALPAQVVVVEVQPGVHAFGDDLSPAVLGAFERACDTVTRLALEPALAAQMPARPLGGRRPHGRRTVPRHPTDVTVRFG